jgi:Xaa-Pro dipeptidase
MSIAIDETARRAGLEAAEAKGLALFDLVEAEGLVRPGRSESEIDNDIYDLARAKFGVLRHWHKRLVRTGINTVCVYSEEPEERIVAPDDTVYLDFGPVFGEWQADIGRSYAMGEDTQKKRLVADLSRLFDHVQAHYRATPDITGAQLYAFAQNAAAESGWLFGGPTAGHIILGEYSMARPEGDPDRNRITAANTEAMRLPDTLGRARHWILEIHLIDRARTFGGFYERLI